MERVLSDEALAQLMADDVPFGDLTTDLLINGNQPLRIELGARYEMTVSGVEEAARMFELKGAKVSVHQPSGATIAANQPILTAHGSANALFTVWKSAQVLMEWMSGVASAAKRMVDGAQGIPVACTRKQVPYTKVLSVKAVRSGGAIMHRLGTSESILVFAEHRQFNPLAPEEMIAFLEQRSPEHKAIIEVHCVEDAINWAQAGAAVLQLDKFSPTDIAKCKAYLVEHQLSTKLGIAGGVTPENITEFTSAGADLIVTSYPYYAKPKDVQVRFFES